MLADEFPDHGFLSPLTIGGTPVTVHVYVEDADAVFAKARRAGRQDHREIENQFYGDRSGSVRRSVGAPMECGQPRRRRLRGGDGPPHGGDGSRLTCWDERAGAGATTGSVVLGSSAEGDDRPLDGAAGLEDLLLLGGASASPSSAAARSRS